MPTYLNDDVTDEYLQDLIAAYREGYTAAGGDPDDSDQAIIDALEAESVTTRPAANLLGRRDAKREQS